MNCVVDLTEDDTSPPPWNPIGAELSAEIVDLLEDDYCASESTTIPSPVAARVPQHETIAIDDDSEEEVDGNISERHLTSSFSITIRQTGTASMDRKRIRQSDEQEQARITLRHEWNKLQTMASSSTDTIQSANICGNQCGGSDTSSQTQRSIIEGSKKGIHFCVTNGKPSSSDIIQNGEKRKRKMPVGVKPKSKSVGTEDTDSLSKANKFVDPAQEDSVNIVSLDSYRSVESLAKSKAKKELQQNNIKDFEFPEARDHSMKAAASLSGLKLPATFHESSTNAFIDNIDDVKTHHNSVQPAEPLPASKISEQGQENIMHTPKKVLDLTGDPDLSKPPDVTEEPNFILIESSDEDEPENICSEQQRPNHLNYIRGKLYPKRTQTFRLHWNIRSKSDTSNPTKFQKTNDYNYEKSRNEALAEQERLLTSAHARMRREKERIHVLHHNQSFPLDGPTFTRPISDLTKLSRDHFKWLDLHARMGLPKDATHTMIKSQYRKLALAYHPDKCTLADASTRFQAITEAYHKLIGKE
jgi:DnaJ-domain-containing protein 1